MSDGVRPSGDGEQKKAGVRVKAGMGQEQSIPTSHPRLHKTKKAKGEKGVNDVGYRGDSKKRGREESFDNDTLEEALDLMSDNDFQNLANKRTHHIKGTISWARLADGASRTIADQFLTLRTDDDLRRAVEHARELHARLQERTGIPHARVTKDQRDKINLLHSITTTLAEITRVKGGSLKPDYDTAGRASMLRQRYRLLGGGDQQPFIQKLMEHAVSKVLTTSSSAAVKSVYNKGLSTWLPSPPPSVPSSPSSGTKVEWDSDDDF